jgi:signal transduction histidine kinase
MSEMHRMLGVLRLDGRADPAEREPQPGVADLPALVRRTRETGLDAGLERIGEPRDLPPGVDLSVYRIAQEALTNVIRHAAARRATVRLRYGPGELELVVTDDGGGVAVAAGPVAGGAEGHGLVGMRERIGLLGGTLTAGPRSGGAGYEVRAMIPVR